MSAKVRLMISIGCALFCGFVVWLYLERAEQKLHARYQMTTVLRAKRFIAAGKLLTDDFVEEMPIPVAYLQPTALQARRHLRNDKGAYHVHAKESFLKGDQITRSHLFEAGALLGLAWAIPEGTTAETVKLTYEEAVGGLLQPGDLVNVLCTFEKGLGRENAQTLTLLKNVRVLAVDDEIWEPALLRKEKSGDKRVQNDSILVTLSLSPKDAARLALAGEKGRLTLTLISPFAEFYDHPSSARLEDLKED